MLHLNQYFIREHVGFMKLTDTYDVIDPATQEQIAIAKEEVSGLIHVLRFLLDKRLLPTTVSVYAGTAEAMGERQFAIKRGFSFLRPKIQVVDGSGTEIGYFQSKLLSLGGAFRVFLPGGEEIALIKGDWKGWNFKFLAGDTQIGEVTKQWAGLGRELFTSADNYMIHLAGERDEHMSMLLLAAGLAIDIVLKEGK